MYQIVFKGCFETVNDPDKFIESIKKLAEEQDVDTIGNFSVFQLADYVDYQKADVTDAQN